MQGLLKQAPGARFNFSISFPDTRGTPPNAKNEDIPDRGQVSPGPWEVCFIGFRDSHVSWPA